MLTVYFFCFMRVRAFDQGDFFLSNSQALRNAQRIRKIFGKDMDQRVHQQLDLYPALDVIIRRKVAASSDHLNETNMLHNETIHEVDIERCRPRGLNRIR